MTTQTLRTKSDDHNESRQPATFRAPRPARHPAEQQPASHVNSPRGLCRSCAHELKCAYLTSAPASVLFCEAFAGPTPVALRRAVARSSREESLADSHIARFAGLCRTCTNRDSCTFPKPEGGVFNCEEYE